MAIINRSVLSILCVIVLGISVTAQDGSGVIQLTVLHNGKKKSAPEKVTLIIGDHTVEEPLKDGQFKIPPEVLSSDGPITFMFVLGKDQIRAEVPTGFFQSDAWVLIMEDHHFDDGYKAFTKGPGVRVRSCCALAIGYKSEGGDAMFYEHCRTRVK